jgi:hypothetical protein
MIPTKKNSFKKSCFVLSFCLVLLGLSGCGTGITTSNDPVANNQFRLHDIIWDINLPDDWTRATKPLDQEVNVPFFATNEAMNVVVLPGSDYREDIIDQYVTNGTNKFTLFELLNQTESSLKFKGALSIGEDETIFDQRIFRWNEDSDLFLIFSCNYPTDATTDACDKIFTSIKQSE